VPPGRPRADRRPLLRRRHHVVVAADRRGDGVGRRLVRAVVGHPDLRRLPGPSLLCREGLVPFHESVGFEEYGDTVELPGRSREPLVRMIYRKYRPSASGSYGNLRFP